MRKFRFTKRHGLYAGLAITGVNLLLIAATIWVAIHFITKYW